MGKAVTKRKLNSYTIDAYSRKGPYLTNGKATGYENMLRERGRMRARIQTKYHTSYVVEVYNNTKGKQIK